RPRPRRRGGGDGRHDRYGAGRDRRRGEARLDPGARQGIACARRRDEEALLPPGGEGDRHRRGFRPRQDRSLSRHRRRFSPRCKAAEGRDPARRQRRALRLDDPPGFPAGSSVAAFRRAQRRQCRLCAPCRRRTRHRRFVGRRSRARSQGPEPHPRLHRRRAAGRPGRARACRRMTALPNSFRTGPDERGFFGIYGGRFVAETLMPLILDLEAAYKAARDDPTFRVELDSLSAHYAGRPSPLYFAERLTEHFRSVPAASGRGGAKIYLKREELNHTGSHKINNCLGQILLARRMGKTRIIAETGAGQHGVAAATVSARFGFPCVVYMGATDVERQKPNVFRMKMLGAEVRPVTSGNGTLKDAMNEALRDWVTNVESTYYLIGTAAGPHPYPEMVRDFQSVIGTETKEQMLEMEGRLPDAVVACIGGGSNAIGIFHPFLDDKEVAIYGVEAGGHGLDVENGHAASMNGGRPGVLHGNRTYLLQDADGQILEGHSI